MAARRSTEAAVRPTTTRSVALAAGFALGAGLVIIATSAYATARIARAVVTPPRTRRQEPLIRSVDDADQTITLASTPDTRVDGRYGLWFDNDSGYARVGAITGVGDGTVIRTLEEVRFGDIHSARHGRWSGGYYLSLEELGFPVESVAISTELGEAPAWRIPPEDPAQEPGAWVIQVHGRGVQRAEPIRAVPLFRELGYTSLLVSYRNDGDAPESPDRRYGLGGTEWRDVDAAIEYAIENGAKSIVLMGWSMGGAIVLQTVTRSTHAGIVHAVILESPVIDWVNTLEFQAQLLRLPQAMARGAMRILESPWGNSLTGQSEAIDLASLDFVTRADDLTLPTLILHSDDDGYVPSTGSRELATARPDIVTLVSFRQARHTKLWNYDRERWNASIGNWLAALDPPAKKKPRATRQKKS